MSSTTYRVIGYGETENGFFNEPAFCSTIGYACGIYNAHLSDPEMDGVVMIRVNHESWEVIQEFSKYPVEIVYSALGTIRVEKVKKLVLV